MDDRQRDMNLDLMLDGNAMGGLLHEIFATEMTTARTECASCAKVTEIGALLAFTQAPGIVLRCPGCTHVILRLVQTPTAIYLDARGAAYLRISR